MIFRIRAVSDLLEPCEVKVSSTVLRGEAGGDTCFLPGGWKRAIEVGFMPRGRPPT
jgi:hypothetical protein